MKEFLAPHNEQLWEKAVQDLSKFLEGDESSFQKIESPSVALKREEIDQRRAEKMEAIGRLAGGVAHDFNNLLSVIGGNAEFVLGSLDKNNLLREEMEEIQKAVRRGAELTKQLLVFGQKHVVQPQYVNLNNITKDMSKMLKRLIEAPIDISIIQEMDLNSILADIGQIQQIILNLALNARDAMQKGGHLIIETRNVEIGFDVEEKYPSIPDGSYVRLSVTDTGIGMSPEIQKHIFEPFFTTKAGKGTGLGLSTVYGIVAKWSGHIFLKSNPGLGTTFSLYFPAVTVKEIISDEPKATKTISRGSETILLAEDDEPVRKVMARSLKNNGYQILEADNGVEAINKAKKYSEPIHLLLTDVIMPKMNGKELADELLKTRPKIRTLFISGYPRDVLSREGILSPDIQLLQKPFELEDLTAKVHRVLALK